ncbi:GDSL-like protein [Leptospira broomii serovar Hurstbridge str. 5399]|uniref:GDSL-like protein n=1 Tax=Leptospira broomii serovar Hurstbridge str. 5399 TaxID=1049789 RepID=T0GMJ0_9LEPT|nr:SGNH/GDSL hydrolase family protein [Leptospira broomii]EQA46563.1 GDSL-like protein [Leptospira broomii serovar Hurstbridge str. 5399]
MIKKILISTLAVFLILLCQVGYVYKQATGVPGNSPVATLEVPKDPGKRIVVCMGDSITHGRVSYDYVNGLASDTDLEKFSFVNAGINSRLAYNLLQKADEVIALKPDFITILIGTNDVKASLSAEESERYIKLWRLSESPSKKLFVNSLRKLIMRLRSETNAKIALVSLPPLGEVLLSKPYLRSTEYSDEIRKIAEAERILYLPLHEEMDAVLRSKGQSNIPEYRMDLPAMYVAIFLHYAMFQDWNSISDMRNLHFLTDNIHLNQRGGDIVQKLIKKFLLE